MSSYMCEYCHDLLDQDKHEDYHKCYEKREALGLVQCDNSNCDVKDNPVTPYEYIEAYKHWRFHGWLFGCSHSN